MKKTYLIDSENINDVWVELISILDDKDEILVFYTEKSAHMGYDRIVRLMEMKRGAIKWIKCFEGQNALDFQLVTELGSRLSLEGKKEYVIVSNDTGYDAVVRYWQQRGCKVRRMKGSECEGLADGKPQAEEDCLAGEETERKAEHAADSDLPEKSFGWEERLLSIFHEDGCQEPEKDFEFLKQLCRTVKISNMSLIHNILEYHLGQETGNTVYRFIKEHPECRGELSAGYSNNKKQRERQYLELILERSGLDRLEGDRDVILKILNAIPRKNLNSIHTALVKKFGQEQGGNYYAIIRNHVKIIRGL